MALCLDSIRVIDLSQVPTGSFCTMLLGDLGADVIKVEPIPRSGEIGLGSPSGKEGEREAAYRAIDRNKKSIALNLKQSEAQEIFYKLVREADVIVDCFRPKVAARLGIDYETISGINPQVIYCAITGYGQDGPYHDLPGHDINYISFGGALGLIGTADGPPIVPMNLVGDYAGGALFPAIAILSALLCREKTGIGQYIDMAMTDGVVSLLTSVSSDYFNKGVVPGKGEGLRYGRGPCYQVYETADGKYLSIGCIEPHFWERLCRVLGREDFIPLQWIDERWEEIYTCFKQNFLSKARDEWFEFLRSENIPAGKVCSLDEVFADPQIVHRHMVQEISHPTLGTVKQVGSPLKLSKTPCSIRVTGPIMGQHTSEILQELGYPAKDVEELEKIGAIMSG